MKNREISKTNKLNKKLKDDISLTEFFEQNAKEFLNVPLNRYIKALIDKKGYTRAKMVRESGINRRYFYDILSGKRNATRNYVLRILLVLETPLKNAQWLLRATGYAQLYARDQRDSVIIYCVNHQSSVKDCNTMLEKINCEPI